MPPTKTERYAWPASVPPRLQKRNLFDVLANGTVSFLYLLYYHILLAYTCCNLAPGWWS